MKRSLPIVALVLATFAAYAGVLSNGFVLYDDPAYVLENPPVRAGLTLRGAAWSLTAFHSANWHPLTWLSHMLDVELFGLAAAGHHAVSVLLHAATAVLVFLALAAATGKRGAAWFVAALFALHPLRVESVAWVAERKDVLAGFFFAATLLAHVRRVQSPTPRAGRVVFLLFLAGLLSKSMLVTLPFVLLLVDVWPLGRRDVTRMLLEKVPLFVLVASVCVLTLASQRDFGAVHGLSGLPLSVRIENAQVAYLTYLAKSIWPVGLSCFYPHPALLDPEGLASDALRAGLVLALVTALCVALRRRVPPLLFGWLWFLGMLVPVIGVVQVGMQGLADRYTYLPLLGLHVAVVFGFLAFVPESPSPSRRRLLQGLTAGGALVLLVFGVLTWRRVRAWENTTTLFEAALAVDPHNFQAHKLLAIEHQRARRFDEAQAAYERALSDRPNDAEALGNLGALHLMAGRPGRARELIERAVALRPDYAEAHFNLGLVRIELRDARGAEASFERALELRPDLDQARRNLELLRSEKESQP